VSGGSSSFAVVVWVLTHLFFASKSSKDFRAGLEDKDVYGRYQQAEEYLKKAKETHNAIMVRNTA
jgi:uncharacterized membrane protein YbaN (DUF454 family)